MASLVLVAFVAGAAGCSDDDASQQGRDAGADASAATDVGASDAAAIGDAARDAGGDAQLVGDGAMVVPDPPSVMAPSANAAVFGVIEVEGTAQAGAIVAAKVLEGLSELGSQRAQVGSDGAFSLSLAYRGAEDNDDLSLVVVVINSAGRSDPTTVALKHTAPLELKGSIVQRGGNNGGTAVYLRLYTSNDVRDLLDHIGEVKLTATAQQSLAATDFSFPVAQGTYYLRAFRDSGDPFGSDPDGYPTLQTDAQTRGATEVTVADGGSSGTVLELVAVSNPNTVYENFDAETVHQDARPRPPFDDVGDQRVVGKGLCGGYYLRVSTTARPGAGALSKPYVKLPDRETPVTLLDDGACGKDGLDNTSSSYDQGAAGDRDFSFGVPNPEQSKHAGDYVLFYEQSDSKFVHIESDTIETVRKLPLLREISEPVGTVVGITKPQVSWGAVAGAGAYEVRIYPLGDGVGNEEDEGRFVTETSYTPARALAFNACYGMEIIAFDTNSREGGETDARAHSASHAFCVAALEGQTVTVSGTISNKTGINAPVVVEVQANDSRSREVNARLPAGTTSYNIKVLKAAPAEANEGSVDVFVDADGTGGDDSLRNDALSAQREGLDMTHDATADLTVNPAIEVGSPLDLQQVEDATPIFTWKDYRMTGGSSAPADFVYGIYVDTDASKGAPGTILGLPATATSIDFGNLPAKGQYFDVGAVISCQEEGHGEITVGDDGTVTCSTQGYPKPTITTLDRDTYYQWGIVVLACAFPDFSDAKQKAAFVECLGNSLSGQSTFVALAGERWLKTP